MHSVRIVIALFCLVVSQPSVWAGYCTWGGGGPDNRWSTAANWISCVGGVPGNGDTVVLPTNSLRPAMVNDIGFLTLAGIEIYGHTVGGVPYSIETLSPLTVTTRFWVNAPAGAGNTGPSVTGVLRLGGPVRIQSMHAEGGPLVFSSIDLNGNGVTFENHSTLAQIAANFISGAGGIIKSGPGVLTLTNGTYTGATLLLEGRLSVRGPQALGATGSSNMTLVSPGAQLFVDTDGTIDEDIRLNGSGLSNTGAIRIAGAAPTFAGPISLASNASIGLQGPRTTRISGAITAPARVLTFAGSGNVELTNPANDWGELVIGGGLLRVGAAGAIPDTAPVLLGPASTLDLGALNETIGPLASLGGGDVLFNGTLTINVPTTASTTYRGALLGTGSLVKTGSGVLSLAGTSPNGFTGSTTVLGGELRLAKTGSAANVGPVLVSSGTLVSETRHQIADGATVTVNSPGQWIVADAVIEAIAGLAGTGAVRLATGTPASPLQLHVGAGNASSTFDGLIEGNGLLAKVGTGLFTINSNHTFAGTVRLIEGSLLLNGTWPAATPISVAGGLIGGRGSVGKVSNGTAPAIGALSPGTSPGLFTVASAFLAAPFIVELAGTAAGTGYDQLRVTADMVIDPAATLRVSRTFSPTPGTPFTIISSAGPVTGTFQGLPEGATLDVDGQRFRITYRGGAGNDVVLQALDQPTRIYTLSEGATGAFFDEDILIANPNDEEAAIEVNFFQEHGVPSQLTRTLAPKSHAVIRVDEVPGLESTTVSAQVVSTRGLPLLVERSMFWDARYYAGHTGAAVERPSTEWYFAEGAQGFFDTFLLIINSHPTPTEVTFAFLRESEAPVTRTVTVPAGSRYTLAASDVSELSARAFGISIFASQTIMAERAMYFGSMPGRQWGGGHESAGVSQAAERWYFAEGATGGFFDTYILVSNPQSVPANLTVQYLLPSGESISVTKTVAAQARLTVNPADEADARLRSTAVSTVIRSDQSIVAERSMYWDGRTFPWGEAHNSFGVNQPGTRWGLAEGRVGGRVPFATYILLANAEATPAEVSVSFLRESGPPIVKSYTVPATSRFNIDAASIEELRDTMFGALIDVTNGVPILVERSMYWNADGVFWSGGTNAMGIRLP